MFLGQRFNTLGVIALVGFVVGIGATLALETAGSTLLLLLSGIQTHYVVAGLVGAVLAIVIAVILAYSKAGERI